MTNFLHPATLKPTRYGVKQKRPSKLLSQEKLMTKEQRFEAKKRAFLRKETTRYGVRVNESGVIKSGGHKVKDVSLAPIKY